MSFSSVLAFVGLFLSLFIFASSNNSIFAVAATTSKEVTTALGILASQMQPGTWAELKTNGFNKGAILVSPNPNAGGIDYITQFADSAAWDPINRRLLFVGSSHTAPMWTLVRYNDANNTWVLGPHPVHPASPTHAYDHNTVDLATGDFYHWFCCGISELRRFSAATNTWTTMPDAPAELLRAFYGAAEFFPELGGVVLVEHSFKILGLFNVKTNQWSILARGLTGLYQEAFAAYNPVHKVMLIGGGHVPDMYKLDASGKVTKLRNAPFPLGGQNTIETADPVTGKYLILSTSGFYEYDIVTDSWRKLSQMPPFWNTSLVHSGVIDGVIDAPISTYGVIMYVVYEYDQSKIYLYKHATAGKKKS